MKNISECIDFIIDNEDCNHCLGVFTFLYLANAPNFVCLAGLFHSIYKYGYTRIEVIDLIGKEAEELVYLFCLFDDNRILRSGNKNLIYLGYANSYLNDELKYKYELVINDQ